MKKTIAITGVSRGLGLAMAQEFISLGHTVIGCARSASSMRVLQEQYGKNHHFSAVDVADDLAVRNWAEEVLGKYPPPDLLINNAGVINQPAKLWEINEAEFSQVIEVNIKGVANVIRHLLPAMIAKKSGIIVNFSSGWGRSTSPEVAPYCASKWAIEGLTKALAQELPAGMAAIPVNPGIVHTDMLEICFGKEAKMYMPAVSWGRKAASFLLSLKPSDNGASLTVS
jgi:NAD(P)-dependent dehydrogenase (short-subunit alcohol dehydrogenase family)